MTQSFVSIRKSILYSLGLLALQLTRMAAPSSALAHEVRPQEQPPERHPPAYRAPRRRRAPTYEPRDFRTDQNFAFELRFGPYPPKIDNEFDGANGPFELIYGNKKRVHVGAEADWQALRIPYLGTLGPGLGWSYVRFKANAPYANDPSVRSPQPTNLWLMPMYGVAVLRVDVLAQRYSIPIVPYAKAGFSWTFWKSTDAGEVSTFDDEKARGLETGLQFQIGGMLWLNWLAPQTALDLDNTAGVNNAYLYVEYLNSTVDSFGKGMQVGTSTWVAGLAWEY